MQKRTMILAATALAGLIAVTGCEDNKKKSSSDLSAPPPSQSSDQLPTPVVSAPPPATPMPGPAPAASTPVPIGSDNTLMSTTPAAPPRPAHTPHTPSSAAGAAYTVKAGDTLFGIARAHYKNESPGKMVKAIVKANPGLDPNHIVVGQKIKLP